MAPADGSLTDSMKVREYTERRGTVKSGDCRTLATRRLSKCNRSDRLADSLKASPEVPFAENRLKSGCWQRPYLLAVRLVN